MKYAAEKDLLFRCIGAKPIRRTACSLSELLNGPLDWRYILRCAGANGIAPIVYDALKRVGPVDAMPQEILRDLERMYHLMAFRNVLLFAELERILLAMEAAGIDIILLKGAALARTVWHNIAMRPMADLDLLVREESLGAAEGILCGLGYVANEWYQTRAWYRDQHHHLAPYHHREKDAVVELHRAIAVPDPSIDLDTAGLWQRARAAKIGGVDTLVLSPEDAIVHLCLQVCHEDPLVGKIRNVIDIAQFTKHHGDGIQWDWIATHAIQRKFARCIYYPLYLGGELFRVSIPEAVLRKLQTASNPNPISDRLLKYLARHSLLMEAETDALFPGWLIQMCGETLLSQESAHRKAAFFWRSLIGPAEGPQVGRARRNDFRAVPPAYPVSRRGIRAVAKAVKAVVRAIS